MGSFVRKEVTEQWDDRGTPPVIGKNEEGIIKSFKKLKSNSQSIGKRIQVVIRNL